MPRHRKKPRRLVAEGRVYIWTMRHGHRKDHSGRAVDCRQILTLSPQPADTGGSLRIALAASGGCPGDRPACVARARVGGRVQ